MAEPLSSVEATGVGLAVIMARKGADGLEARLGMALPDGPGWTGNAALTLIGTGPGTWLARCEHPAPDWGEALADRLAGLASVSDVSAAYRLFRIAGAGAATVLQRGAFVDFAEGFGPGSAAVTVIAHIGVIVRQIDAAPTYELAVSRSYAESFRHWLNVACDQV